jgi:hypothetical protein
LLARDFASGLPYIENIKGILSGQPAESLMRAVGVAPVAYARKQQENDTEPQKPPLAKVPIVPIRVSHVILLNHASLSVADSARSIRESRLFRILLPVCALAS